MMKKLVSMFCALSMAATMLTGCGQPAAEMPEAQEQEQTATTEPETVETPEEPETPEPFAETDSVPIRVAALKGPTAMGMVQMMDASDKGELEGCDYTFSIEASADLVTPLLAKGEMDLAAVPANLASVLYNNMDGGVEVLAINTLGVLYMVESGDTISTVEDLRGKTIYASGKDNTPEYALNYVLEQNGIDPTTDVTIEWKSEHSECLAALLAQENAVAMLPQPFVTTAQMQSDQIRVALDLTEEWDRLQADSETPSSMITGVLIGRREFVESHPDAVTEFLEHYQTSVDYVNNNVEDAAQLVGQYDIVPAQVAVQAIPACNITLIRGQELQEKLSGYLTVLLEQNPKSIGGAMPADDFYFLG